MSKPWSEVAWDKATPIFTKITQHPFIKCLIDGTLSQKQFMFYIAQDSIYLSEFGKVLAGISAKLSDSQQRSALLKFATDTVFVEQNLHNGFIDALKSNQKAKATPSCMLYTSFLQKQLATQPIEVALAAVLPCFVIYKKTGDYIVQNQTVQANPYQNWIDTYGGDDFAKAVQQAEGIANNLAEKANEAMQQKMTDAYLTASKLEWMFWNSAYELEKWPI
ncbi:thiaminase II [Labilibaculum filiforme]|uniref:Aminopyrimidine aminohydrolase n=1 Tax=Labilibaculum filiforme TaxID=1940526 RepID=A0A2N3HVG7_9BACT|nr:thiaminase II [Labilibaculum filiforme]PKQ62050.1 thiaminase II [Labilibaculum filiforme]